MGEVNKVSVCSLIFIVTTILFVVVFPALFPWAGTPLPSPLVSVFRIYIYTVIVCVVCPGRFVGASSISTCAIYPSFVSRSIFSVHEKREGYAAPHTRGVGQAAICLWTYGLI